MATHNMEIVDKYKKRIIHLEDGKIKEGKDSKSKYTVL